MLRGRSSVRSSSGILPWHLPVWQVELPGQWRRDIVQSTDPLGCTDRRGWRVFWGNDCLRCTGGKKIAGALVEEDRVKKFWQ